jgi:hypothetical protein
VRQIVSVSASVYLSLSFLSFHSKNVAKKRLMLVSAMGGAAKYIYEENKKEDIQKTKSR